MAGILLILPGCGSFGPPSLDRDRFDYINAIASSWKQQTLLNIVKMRYADTPVFLDVGQIISGYQLQGTVTVGGTLNSASAIGDILNLGSAGTYSDRPTITYTPLTGAHFMQVMITPIPPPALLMRAEEGWPIDTLLQIGAQSINGLSNRKGGARGHAADPDFVRLLAALQRLQASGVIDLRVEVSKESKQEGTVMVISHEELPPEIRADRELVRKLLGLRTDLQEFKIVSGTVSGKDDVIAMKTRSGFQILNLLGSNVEVPPEHIAERRTYPPIPEAGGIQSLPPLIRIHAEKSQPADAFAAVKYRDYWYWIDDRDFRSKGVFTFLMIIMTLAEKEEKVQPPVVTIQGN
ncbi:MAG: hypothetical protein PHD43_18140 [Methylococcales bacterium]|nr:hypothetical protein [Methylococcales bacterium]